MSPNILCIANQRGGVGKTTTAVSLAHGLALKGKRVLLVDLDPQGQCAAALGRGPEPGAFHLLTMGTTPPEIGFLRSWIRATGRDGLWLIAGDQQTKVAETVLNAQNKPLSSIRNSVHQFFKDTLDYILFDTAPSVGGIEERAVWAADLVIVPTATDFLSADGLAATLHMLGILQEKKKWRGNLLGVLPTFHDQTARASQAAMEEMQQLYPNHLLPPIHHSVLLRECFSVGQSVFEFDPLSRAAREYLALTRLAMKF